MTFRDDDDKEKPLDPATERVRRKMARLLAVSIGIMMVGLMAVLGAIVYKIGGTPAPVASGGTLALDLPAGKAIGAMALDGDRALLHVGEGAGEELVLIDLATGKVLSRYAVRHP